ncbi:dTDP-4-dehydrorhamnose reductase [Solilutibacter silvestris]|uniref:dTDP-4-dehydrorhamnose reductase n=1 Tax=Solilutibacter silvestris TaxID=1645665 RepID=A0A2K1Q2F7_9GAMM|nr:dTDP-4-dehydrorhamnose reductase [Lysobacter silvestris]PNS09226.1 rmlD: dTDP-4-dehydrorhamnose reductase [Lysobacter silvestris]
MSILLVGGNGQVGHELRRSLATLGDVAVTTRTGQLDGSDALACDLSQPGALTNVVGQVAPDIVVNAAAYTAVDKAENESELAFRINAGAVEELAKVCATRGIPLIHYSTDYVFDGLGERPYQPDDATSPLGVYGASKLAGEEAIRASGAKHLILRTAWVYGLHGHNFLKTMLRVGAERDELRVVSDQIGSPTPAWLIADVTAKILKQGIGAGGVHHLVTAGQTSWQGFAEAIFDEAVAARKLARKPVVHAIPTSDYSTPARRPPWSVLDTGSVRQAYEVVLPDWREALRRTFVLE